MKKYDLIQHPELIDEVLERFDGMLQGHLIVKESEFNIEIMDGNHRCAAIHRLTTLGKEYKNLRIGVQVFYENDLDRQRQAFVDLNTSTPIDKTLLTLFGQRDALSVAAKETIGTNPDYRIEEFDFNSPHFIGFDVMNDSVNKNTTAVFTLNIVKNTLIKFALGEGGTKKKFESLYKPGTEEYDILLKDFAKYLKVIFRNVAPFEKIKQMGIQAIPELREEYVSITGAGLYLIANIGHEVRKQGMDFEQTAIELSKINWKQKVDNGFGEEYNPVFRSGILNESGNISNNRNAQTATLSSVLTILGIQ